MTYYEILGVGDQATADEIKRAYRKLASQHHPDKGGDKARFQEIQQAYDTLSDNGRRQQYDMQRNGMGGPGGMQFHWHSSDMNHPDLSEIFRSFGFGGDPFGHVRQQQRRNKDLRIEIPLPLVSTLEEQTKTVSVQTTNGHRETVEVKIPRGVTTGTQIKYTGLGDNLFNTLPRGDLYVQFTVHGADGYVANGIDLYHKISVNCLNAIVGCETIVDGLDGKKFAVTIPAGTQYGSRFRIPHQGLYVLNSSHKGDLYIEVEVRVPQDLTSDQLETIKTLTANQ
jgi:DnaJ-class molecular chaperone